MFKNTLIVIIIFIIQITNAQNFSNEFLTLNSTNYEIEFQFDFKKEKLFSKCDLTILNSGTNQIKTVPLLLYRLLHVSKITDDKGNEIPYIQKVMSLHDWESMQVNSIEVRLKTPILPNQSKVITIEYSGYLFGYTETGMLYVQDKIDPAFTILRPDCFAYPVIGVPSYSFNKKIGLQNFDYKIKVDVPDTLLAVNGGRLLSIQNQNGKSTFIYNNIKKSWRIDLVIGNYEMRKYENAKIYYFKEDSIGMKNLYKYLKKTFELYTNWWGKLKEFNEFSVIEIPNGFGSQADVTSILQTASAFNDTLEMHQMYHEISHLWNVESNDIFDPRWNEGLATFIEYLTIEKLENRAYLDYVSDWYLKNIIAKISKDTIFAQTPLIKFGEKGLTDNSYSLGMITFYLLYKVVGEDNFHEIIKSYYNKFHSSGSTTEEFIKNSIQISNIDLNNFFNDWFYSVNYMMFFKRHMTLEQISSFYKDKDLKKK